MLLHDIGKPSCFTMDAEGNGHFYGHPAVSRDLADGMLRRLKCGNADRETVLRLVEWHDRNIPRTDRGLRRALRALGADPLAALADNDSYHALERCGGLIRTGPTGTNVNDVAVVLIRR